MYKYSIYNNLIDQTDDRFLSYNALSGELIRFDPETFHFISNIHLQKDARSHPHFAYLLEKGFIVHSNTDEYERVHALRRQMQYAPDCQRSTFVIALTTSCNLKCVYCYESGCVSHTMTSGTADQVIAFIRKKCNENKMLRTVHITWFGGEPLLAMDRITQIGSAMLEYCGKHDIRLTTNMITNGTLLTEEALNLLKKYHLTDIQISMDGCLEYFEKFKKGTQQQYNSLLENIRTVCPQVPTTIRLNCSRENYPSILRLCSLLYQDPEIRRHIILSFAQITGNAVDQWSNSEFSKQRIAFLQYLRDLGWKEQIRHYLPAPRTVPCGLMQAGNFVIDPEGCLYKCEHYVGQPDYSVGTVWDGVVYPRFYNSFMECPVPDACRDCSIFPLCRGGCTQRRFSGSSSVDCVARKEEVYEILRMAYPVL